MKKPKTTDTIVAGVMSGTSADGINVAGVRISGDRAAKRGMPGAFQSRFELLGHAEFSYPQAVRQAVLAAMNAQTASVADLARLNFLLGELYAEAVLSTQRRLRIKVDLVGCHGQTIYHQGEPKRFLGRSITATWQTGEAAIVAARVGVPVVSDFRPSDLAAGGKGAPLVPYLDYFMFRDDSVGRIVQNIGGIANLTSIPPGSSSPGLVAFDTGPGNMVIDAVTEKLFGRSFDRGGEIAASGKVLKTVVGELLKLDFFRRKPPKTAGREEFGREFVRGFLNRCGGASKQDIVATATALTAASIAESVRRFVVTSRRPVAREMILSGGGTKNPTLVNMLADALQPL
jgi:anhydro-N-acetylmuramic acid kinase